MKSVISKLYYGEICPCEKPAPQSEQCIENRKLICDTEEQLLVHFPDCKELLDTNAGSIEGVSQNRTRTCAYKADTEIPMHSTLKHSLNAKRTLNVASGSEQP